MLSIVPLAVGATLALTAGPAAARPVLGIASGAPAGPNPVDVAVADLNGDHRPDLIAVDPTTNDVYYLRGLGNGRFVDGVGTSTGTLAGTQLAALDVDGDGNQDVVVTNGTTSYATLLGDGTGALGTAVLHTNPAPLTDPLAADFDGDGGTDLVAPDPTSPQLSELANTGTSVFATPVTTDLSAFATLLGGAAAADLDGDGATDLAVTAPAGDKLITLGNDGHAGFSETATPSTGTGTHPVSVATGDLDGDGVPDLVTADANSDEISALLGDSAHPGRLLAPARFAAGHSPAVVALGALDHTGLSALVANGDGLTLLPGNGDGTFGAPITFPTGQDQIAVVTADFNGDGLDDEASLTDGTFDISVRLSVATAEPDTTRLDFTPGGETQTVTFTNHGGPDLAIDAAQVRGPNTGDFRIVGDTCTSSSVAPDDTCAVTVRWAPTVLHYDAGATLVLTGNQLPDPPYTWGTRIALHDPYQVTAPTGDPAEAPADPPPVPPVPPTTTTTTPAGPVTPVPPAGPKDLVLPARTPAPKAIVAAASFTTGGTVRGCARGVAATARVNLSTAATVAASAKARGVTVATASRKLKAGRSSIALCLTPAGQKLVKPKGHGRARTLKATATLRVSAAGYATKTLTAPLRVTYRR